MIVAFCGHRKVDEPAEVARWLDKVVGALVREGAVEFWSGGKGEFSYFGVGAVTALQVKHPHLRRVLVQAYIDQEGDPLMYDEKMYPPLEGVPLRFAMLRRAGSARSLCRSSGLQAKAVPRGQAHVQGNAGCSGRAVPAPYADQVVCRQKPSHVDKRMCRETPLPVGSVILVSMPVRNSLVQRTCTAC